MYVCLLVGLDHGWRWRREEGRGTNNSEMLKACNVIAFVTAAIIERAAAAFPPASSPYSIHCVGLN